MAQLIKVTDPSSSKPDDQISPEDPHGGRREATPTSYPLASILAEATYPS